SIIVRPFDFNFGHIRTVNSYAKRRTNASRDSRCSTRSGEPGRTGRSDDWLARRAYADEQKRGVRAFRVARGSAGRGRARISPPLRRRSVLPEPARTARSAALAL